jgi:hypothetical protein
MTEAFQKIPHPKPLDDRAMLLVDLLDENDRLRAALADLGADYVLLKWTLAQTIQQLSALRVRELRRQLADQAYREAA